LAVRAGFTVLEVVVASSVLVVALLGVMTGSFAVLKNSKSGDLSMQAANLAAERLAYFRACPNPYIAVGGTYYPAPENPRTHRDYNTPPWADNFHNVWNNEPQLLVREWLYDSEQVTARSALTNANPTNALTRKFAQIAPGALIAIDTRLNSIPPMRETVPGNNGQTAIVAGVYADWFSNNKGAPNVRARPIFVNAPPGGEPDAPQVAFVPVPMANEPLRGLTNVADGSVTGNQLPRTVKFVREVWVQTNSPLGRPFGNRGLEFVGPNRTAADRLPGLYRSGGAGVPTLVTFRRDVTGPDATTGTMAMDVPLWVATVTVRVFLRDPTTLLVENSTGVRGTTRTSGAGYDPARPLAVLVGYFGLRRNF
jgi:Tfp pilus assembly protein PilV